MDMQGYGYEMKNKAKIILVDMFNKAMIDDMVNKKLAWFIQVIRDEEHERRVMIVDEQTAFFDTIKGTFYDAQSVTKYFRTYHFKDDNGPLWSCIKGLCWKWDAIIKGHAWRYRKLDRWEDRKNV